jgi:hypothetical protein
MQTGEQSSEYMLWIYINPLTADELLFEYFDENRIWYSYMTLKLTVNLRFFISIL